MKRLLLISANGGINDCIAIQIGRKFELEYAKKLVENNGKPNRV